MATRTKAEQRITDSTQGALALAAIIARVLADRLDKGADHIRYTETEDGGRIVPAVYQEAYAVRTLDALRELLYLTTAPA